MKKRSAKKRPADSPADLMTAVAIRVMGAVERQIAAVERIAAGLNPSPEHAEEAERAARTLASLSRTLAELKTIMAGKNETPEAGHDDFPRSDEELRSELLRKMDALVAGQSAEISREPDAG